MKSILKLVSFILLMSFTKAFPQEVLSYTMSRCLGSEYKIDPWSFGLDIDTTFMNGDTITMVGTMLANCGDHNVAQVRLQEDTLNLVFTDTGNVPKCTCWRPFEFQFRVPYIPRNSYLYLYPNWGAEYTYYRPDTTYLTDQTSWTYGFLETDPIQHIAQMYQYSLQGDTVLDAITYRKVRNTNGPVWGIRESEKKMYARDLSTTNGIDLLLYDFNLKLNDRFEVENSFGYSGSGQLVTQVDSVVLDNGEKRKRIVMGNSYTWIEGIGDLKGLFAPVEPIPTCMICPYNYTKLVCFKQQGSVVYSNQQYCLTDCCAFTDGSGLHTRTQPDADVFVVPETRELVVWMVQDDDPIIFVRLLDTTGKLARAVPVDGLNQLRLNTSAVPRGVYLVEITTAQGRVVKKVAL